MFVNALLWTSGLLACLLLGICPQVIPALGRWIKVNVSDKWSGPEILACHEAAIAVTLPKPVTSGIEAKGHFGKQDFRFVAEEDTYVCPARRKARLFVYDARQRNGFASLPD